MLREVAESVEKARKGERLQESSRCECSWSVGCGERNNCERESEREQSL